MKVLFVGGNLHLGIRNMSQAPTVVIHDYEHEGVYKEQRYHRKRVQVRGQERFVYLSDGVKDLDMYPEAKSILLRMDSQ